MGQDRRIVTKGPTHSGIHGAVQANAARMRLQAGRLLNLPQCYGKDKVQSVPNYRTKCSASHRYFIERGLSGVIFRGCERLWPSNRRACVRTPFPNSVPQGRLNFRPAQLSFEERLGSATTLYGTVALSFVIPSEAEGSAVLRTSVGNAEYYTQTKLSSRPERSVVERSAVFFYFSRRF
jgi:hypothetical protein